MSHNAVVNRDRIGLNFMRPDVGRPGNRDFVHSGPWLVSQFVELGVRWNRLAFKALLQGVTLACLVVCATVGVSASAETPGVVSTPGCVWHVSPRELAGVPPADQLRTISEAAVKAGPGDTVLIHDGVYRECVTVTASGTAENPITFEAVPGENVVVTGADRLAGLRKEKAAGHVFSAPWPHEFIGWNKSHAHPDDARHLMIGRAEQVFVSGYPLLQVFGRGELQRGTFRVDLDKKRLYLRGRDDGDLGSADAPVEASAREAVWMVKADHVRIRGIRFRYAANMAQHGGGQFNGNSIVVEDGVFERMNSSGASFRGKDQVVRRCTFQDNGQQGFDAEKAHSLLFTGCTVRDNNVKDFDRGWEAGGCKLCLCRGAVIEKSVFESNRGAGIWFDIGNEDCVVRNCLIADNEDAGLFYEISFRLHAHDNVILGNGFAGTPGSWGASSGISLSSSPGCVVERNLIVGNKEGFNFREQERTTPLIDNEKEQPVWNHDESVRNNILAWNRDAQTWGWFDVADGRHWPERLKLAKTKLTLEELNLDLHGNFYAPRPYQGLFNWGVTWGRNERYPTLDDVRRELNLETASQSGEIRFADFHARDLRVPPDCPAVKLACYPVGDVPGVLLGTMRMPSADAPGARIQAVTSQPGPGGRRRGGPARTHGTCGCGTCGSRGWPGW